MYLSFSAQFLSVVGYKYLFDKDVFIPLQPTIGKVMLDTIKQLGMDMFNNTFGEMNGKEILWTIMGLLALYQLVMIKWRLINNARHEQIRHNFMRGGFTPMRSGFNQSKRSVSQALDNSLIRHDGVHGDLEQTKTSRSQFGFDGSKRGGITVL